jgi:hypothetical protein
LDADDAPPASASALREALRLSPGEDPLSPAGVG